MLLCVLFVALNGCASKSYSLRPLESKSNQIWLQDGVEYLISKKKQSTVVLHSAGHNSQREFYVYVEASNKSGTNRKFIPNQHIEAFFIPQAGRDERERTKLTVYPFDTYLKLVKKRQENAESWNAVAQGMAAASAAQGQATSRTTASATYSDNYGYSGKATGSSTTTTRYTDPLARELAMQRAQQNVRDLANANANQFQATAQSILRRTTIKPKATARGVVYIRDGGKIFFQPEDRLVLRIYIGSEKHTLHFKKAR